VTQLSKKMLAELECRDFSQKTTRTYVRIVEDLPLPSAATGFSVATANGGMAVSLAVMRAKSLAGKRICLI
jgi:hypothetical protein